MAELHEDLRQMDCEGLLAILWSFWDEAMVQEVVNGAFNQYDNTVRCDPGQWMMEKWREVFKFRAAELRWLLERTTSPEVSSHTRWILRMRILYLSA